MEQTCRFHYKNGNSHVAQLCSQNSGLCGLEVRGQGPQGGHLSACDTSVLVTGGQALSEDRELGRLRSAAVASGHSRPFCVKVRPPTPGFSESPQSTGPACPWMSRALTHRGAAVLACSWAVRRLPSRSWVSALLLLRGTRPGGRPVPSGPLCPRPSPRSL